jgi:hypothetical protein
MISAPSLYLLGFSEFYGRRMHLTSHNLQFALQRYEKADNKQKLWLFILLWKLRMRSLSAYKGLEKSGHRTNQIVTLFGIFLSFCYFENKRKVRQFWAENA